MPHMMSPGPKGMTPSASVNKLPMQREMFEQARSGGLSPHPHMNTGVGYNPITGPADGPTMNRYMQRELEMAKSRNAGPAGQNTFS